MFLTLLLLNYNRSFKVQVVFLLKDVEKGWVSASIDTDFLEFVPKMVLDRLLLKLASLQDDIVLAFKHKAVDYEILAL